MNDRDQFLQDEFDRHFRGNGSPPDTENDPEAAAYEMVFSALQEEPDGDLPDDFAEQVADRAGVRTAPSIVWGDVVLLFLAIAGLGATLVVMPSVSTVFQETIGVIGRSLRTLSAHIRVDIVAAAGLVLIVTLGLDALLSRWPSLRRAPTPSS